MQLKHYILAFMFLACQAIHAGENLCFDHFTTKNGICCDFILDIDQDKNGFIWVATKDGVSRFDGANFKNYSKKQGGLMENDVHCVHLSMRGELLIGSSNGMLQAYDAQSDRFVSRRFPELMEKYVKSVIQISKDQDGRDFLLTTSGVFSYDTLRKSFGPDPQLGDSTSQLLVNAFYQDKKGRFWIGAFDGLHIFSDKGLKEKYYSLSADNGPASTILEVDSAHVLVATNMGGVWMFHVTDEGLPKAEVMRTPFKNTSVMLKDSKGNIWFGTWGDGLWKMDVSGKFTEIKSYGAEDDLQKSHALFEDSDHSIWVGTQVNGLFRLQTDNQTKILHSSEMGYPKVDASCFIERTDGKIYVGSDGSGAFLVDAEGKMERSLQEEFNAMGASILSFSRYSDDDILVSSWFGGIGEISAEGKVTPLKYEGLTNTVNSSKCVHATKDGEIWAATQGDGLYVRKKSGTWEKQELVVNDDVTDRWIDDIEEAPDGTKWLLSYEYIWRFDDTGKRHYQWADSTKSSEKSGFNDCTCDKEGNLFVASNVGIIRLDKEKDTVELLDYAPAAKFVSLFVDKNGYLWGSGQNGICRINVKERNYKNIPLPTDKYGKLYFQPRAIYESSKGNIFFGCSNGFIMLNPTQLGVANAVDYAAWRGAESRDEKGMLSRFTLTDHIVRIESNNVETRFAFDVVSLAEPDVVCRYRINQSEEWNFLGNQREILFNHLAPGKYDLELMIYKDGGENNAVTLHQTIAVENPWWLKWWFHLLVALLLGGVGYAIYRKRKEAASQPIQTAQQVVYVNRETPSSEDAAPSQPTMHPFIAQVYDVIEHNYEDPDFSVEELAKELNTSKSTLIRKLKPLTEQTPVEMIGEYRLKKADEMLRTMDLPVKEVAFKTGFSSPYYFSRKYKEFFGYPPSQIKEKE